MSALRGKQILFIGTGFYDYEASIVERLTRHGAMVRTFLPAVLRKGIWGLARRLSRPKGEALIDSHERAILRCAADLAFDYVLVIKSVDLRTQFLEELRHHQPNATFILYLWDSLAKMQEIGARLPYFDRVLTFDRADAALNTGFQFRPLFYRDNSHTAAEPSRDSRIDLCFVGWLHSERLETIRRIQSIARSQHMSFFVYFFTGVRTAIKLVLGGNGRDIHVTTMPYDQLLVLYRRAAVIVDLPHASQTGLTMRAIETMGHGKKLLTTARDVVNYDFYSRENVRLMRADDPQLDADFVCADPAPYPAPIRRRYSLDAWIEDVFCLPGPLSSL